MQWIKDDSTVRLAVKSWCADVDTAALQQAVNLANHPKIKKHVALMPDCHMGYGMPIGGVIGCKDTVIPNAVGVDIGCGMGAVQTDFPADKLTGMKQIREIFDFIKSRVPLGEGHAHKRPQPWKGFSTYLEETGLPQNIEFFSDPIVPGWMDGRSWKLAKANLGSLGGGNHFIELQRDENGLLWLMLHSGSRNLGYRIANYYHKTALALNEKWGVEIPDKELAYLLQNSKEGKAYIRDMNFALSYAAENRHRMMEIFKYAVEIVLKTIHFEQEINIHHNYAALEEHFGEKLWIHRKGATSAKIDEMGIIPGSMGTSSYIVRGLGNPESFMSCSHGAGRVMGRKQACRELLIKDCDIAMEGIVHDRWSKVRMRGKNKEKAWDLSEAPQAYKNIDTVIEAELDLIKPQVKLKPLGVIKG